MKPESISAKEFIDEQVKIAKSRGSKYRNKKVVIDGITFASIKEGNRYKELKLMDKAGEIDYLSIQHTFPLCVNGKLICNYDCDFRYLDLKTGKFVVEDVKSEITRKNPVYRIKKKLMKAIYDIDILET